MKSERKKKCVFFSHFNDERISTVLSIGFRCTVCNHLFLLCNLRFFPPDLLVPALPLPSSKALLVSGSCVGGTEQGGYWVRFGVTRHRGSLVGHTLSRTLELQTVLPWEPGAGGAWDPLPLHLRVTEQHLQGPPSGPPPGDRALSGWAAQRMFRLSLLHELPGPAAEVRWEALPGTHFSPLLAQIPGPGIRINLALGSVGQRSGDQRHSPSWQRGSHRGRRENCRAEDRIEFWGQRCNPWGK